MIKSKWFELPMTIFFFVQINLISFFVCDLTLSLKYANPHFIIFFAFLSKSCNNYFTLFKPILIFSAYSME